MSIPIRKFLSELTCSDRKEIKLDYLTVTEMANLKKCSIQYVKRICKEGKIKTELQPHPQNKQPCYMIPVSALSEDLQARYYARLKKDTGLAPELMEGKPEKL